jgi:outer membrane immunogenic protein
MKKTVVATLACLGLGTTMAAAADMPLKAPPPIVPVFSWSGFYVGWNVGAGWGTKEWTATSERFDGQTPVLFTTGDVVGANSVNGLLGGGQVGWNWQSGWAVWGIEAQGEWANLRGFNQCFQDAAPGGAFDFATRCGTNVRALGTVAARFGLTSDRTMIYVKAGGAWANDRFSLHQTTNPNFPPFGTFSYGDINDTRTGGMVGVGVEHAVSMNWSAKMEYNFMDFGTKSYAFAGLFNPPGGGTPTPVSFTSDITQYIHIIKFGVNYRFNWGGPVVASY